MINTEDYCEDLKLFIDMVEVYNDYSKERKNNLFRLADRLNIEKDIATILINKKI